MLSWEYFRNKPKAQSLKPKTSVVKNVGSRIKDN